MNDAVEELGIFFAVGLFGDKEVVLPDGGGGEGVGFDDIGTAFEVSCVDFADNVGACEEEDFVVSLEVFSRPVFEAVTPVVRFAEFVPLDHGAHPSVEQGDTLGEEFSERVG